MFYVWREINSNLFEDLIKINKKNSITIFDFRGKQSQLFEHSNVTKIKDSLRKYLSVTLKRILYLKERGVFPMNLKMLKIKFQNITTDNVHVLTNNIFQEKIRKVWCGRINMNRNYDLQILPWFPKK